MAKIKYVKSWDKGQDEALIQMMKEGVSREEIALRMGRTESSIQSRASHLRNSMGEVLPMIRSRRMVECYEREAKEIAPAPHPDTLAEILNTLRMIHDLIFDMKVNTDAINAELLK